MVFSEKVFPENPWDNSHCNIYEYMGNIPSIHLLSRKKKTKWQELLKEGKYI